LSIGRVNMFDLVAVKVERLAAAGRNCVQLGPKGCYARRTNGIDPRVRIVLDGKIMTVTWRI
jgi:hypothetical protein